jgi:hypothetical protein
MFCSSCGTQLPAAARFCMNCGAQVGGGVAAAVSDAPGVPETLFSGTDSIGWQVRLTSLHLTLSKDRIIRLAVADISSLGKVDRSGLGRNTMHYFDIRPQLSAIPPGDIAFAKGRLRMGFSDEQEAGALHQAIAGCMG